MKSIQNILHPRQEVLVKVGTRKGQPVYMTARNLRIARQRGITITPSRELKRLKPPTYQELAQRYGYHPKPKWHRRLMRTLQGGNKTDPWFSDVLDGVVRLLHRS